MDKFYLRKLGLSTNVNPGALPVNHVNEKTVLQSTGLLATEMHSKYGSLSPRYVNLSCFSF